MAADELPVREKEPERGREAPPTARRRRLTLLVGNLVVWVVIPAAWLLGAWAVGPSIPRLTLALIPVALVGMGLSMFGAGRWFLRRAVRKGLVEAPAPVRWQGTRPARRQLEVVRPARPTELPLRNHVLAGVLFATMILVAVGIVTAVPLAFVWVASQLSATTAPGTRPYLLVAVGTALGAAIGLRLLTALHRWHSELTGWRNSAPRPASWNRSVGDTEWVREPGAVVEWIVVFIVLAAAVALFVWIFAFADPAKLVPQELQPT